MIDINSIARSAQKTRQLTFEQIYQINTLLNQQNLTGSDLQALDRLIDDLITRRVESHLWD